MKTLFLCLALAAAVSTRAAVEWQPFKAQVTRVLDALEFQGATLPPADMRAAREALEAGSGDDAADRLEAILDKHVLVEVDISPESRVKLARGKASAELAQSGWRAFLVKV